MKMGKNWTHLIRFVAKEDGEVHLGQLVDTSRDVGLDSYNGVEIKAYEVTGTVLDGTVNEDKTLTVKELLSPVSREECNYIRCAGLNYVDHAKEANRPLPSVPILFAKPRSTLIGPYPALVNIPKVAQDGTSDYEAELCLVISKTARDIPEEKALDYVLGYTASNDVSARALQRQQPQWCFGKGLDDSCPIGPVLVSSEVIKDPQDLSIKAIHNDKVVQDGHTKDMIFDVKKLVSFYSKGTTLEAGTIILTGTPAGIGFFHDPRICLNDRDDMRVQISSIGTLINKIKYL
jgi:2-keto-4-pentenoate hydratase/2-oxohepta-3-ene-1,7-dioic acid hydratase in catechol pathway